MLSINSGIFVTLQYNGIDYDYIEQISYLLFIKMAHEGDRPLPNG